MTRKTKPPRPTTAFIGPFTKRFVNPVTRLVAGHLPWFAILIYRGRKSGKTYRTPMNVFRHGTDYVFALTYSSEVQWVKNVLAAGGCQMETRDKTIRLIDPQVFVDPKRRLMPLPVRLLLGLMRVSEFMRMRPVDA
jgi:deazaflavin-dependent oxidoreductase (nitroreductase family)